MKVSVIGLGKLGLCTAACFATNGHKVVGYDNNKSIINMLRDRQCSIDEPDLDQLLKKAWYNFVTTDSIEKAVLHSEITLIIVPTPSLPDGRFTNKYVENVLLALAPLIKEKKDFHVIDIVSTVMPGSSEKCFKPLLEKITQKACGTHFGLVYNPEFIALGSVIKNFLNPDMVLIGASDVQSASAVQKLYSTTCNNSPIFSIMSLTNAEITKLSLNCFVTMKISFANELASICEKIPGADIDIITDALGSDSRIGGKYLKGGLGFGGPCFPRDNLAFQAFAKGSGSEARLGPQTVAINNSVVDRLFNIIKTEIDKNKKVALLGLSYKPGTHLIEESQSIMLARKLIDAGYRVSVHDPKALKEARVVLNGNFSYSDNPYACVESASAVVFLTNWKDYTSLDWFKLAGAANKDALLVDSWRIFKEIKLNSFRYKALGLGMVYE